VVQIKDGRDFAIVVPSYLDDYGLDPYEYRLYSHIVRRAGKNGCFESIPNMARHCLMSEKTLRSSLRVLLNAGMVGVAESKAGKSVVYEVTQQEKWVASDVLEIIRGKRTPGKSATTTPGKSATTTPGKSATTTPGKSATTTPGKSATTPVANLLGEVFPSKEVPFKELPLRIREDSPTPISQVEIVLDEDPEPDQLIIQKTTNSLTVKNSDLQIKKDVPALVRVESKHAETIADKLRRIYHETGILPKIPMEIDVMVQAELGDQIVALYRTSGRITTRSRGDISLDFANYVTEQNKSGQNPDVNYGYSYIRKLEWGDDGRKRDWEVLAVLVAKWQAAKATGDRNLNIAKEVQRASKPKIAFTGKL